VCRVTSWVVFLMADGQYSRLLAVLVKSRRNGANNWQYKIVFSVFFYDCTAKGLLPRLITCNLRPVS
jgi:hypothetical protein